MILTRSIWPYVRPELGLGLVAGTAAWLLVDRGGLDWLALPSTLAVVLGTALSIQRAARVTRATGAGGRRARSGPGSRTWP